MSDPNKLTRIIDAATATMSDKDRALVCTGAELALGVMKEEWKDLYSWLDNSRPDPIAVTPTVRR